MNKNQIKYIVEDVFKDSLDTVIPFTDCKFITLSKSEFKFTDASKRRYKFDTTNEILECYFCEEFTGTIPSNWVIQKDYDIINGKKYQYLKNLDGKVIIDYYDFDAIVAFNTGVRV